MSPKEVANKYLPGAISGAIVTIIGVFLAHYLNASKVDSDLFQKKLDEKAPYEYIDKEIKRVEEKNATAIESFKEVYTVDTKWIKDALMRLENQKK